MNYILRLVLASIISMSTWYGYSQEPFIVGVVATRNGSLLIEACLRGMAPYTDAIVVLDDVSQDNTVEIVEHLAQELPIARIIKKTVWIRDERADKWMLLKAARELGATHVIMLDDDEILSANCATDNWLKKEIAAMKPGQIMTFPMVNLWDSTEWYRDDALCSPHSWKWGSITAVFCDDGACNYDTNPAWGPSGSMHISRAPANRKRGDYPDTIKRFDITYVLLHFKSVYLEDIRIKKAWYLMLEFLKLQEEKKNTQADIKKLNDFYDKEFAGMLATNDNIHCAPVPAAWTAYPWFDPAYFRRTNIWRQQDIINWFTTYGTDYFNELHIWDIGWVQSYLAQNRLHK